MKKTIFLSGALLISSTHFFAKSKENMDSFQNFAKHAIFDFGKDNPKQLTSPAFSITPTFDPIAIINFGDIESQLPVWSSNGIFGKWYLWSTAATNDPNTWDCTYKFVPASGQNATSVTMIFTVFAKNIIKANTGSCKTNIFNLITLNGQYTVTSDIASVSIDFPENAGNPITLDSAGNVIIPSGLPEGNYKIKYKVWLNNCDANYSTGYFYVGIHYNYERKAPQKEINSELTIYPNPSKDFFNIDLRGTEEQYDQIKIFSVTGALIHEGQLISGSVNTIDLSNAKTGCYFAQISNNTNSKTLSIIKE